MENLTPKRIINYQGKDVTGDFAPILTSVSYRDYLDGKAGELEIRLSNDKGLFLGGWYPDIDDEITVLMGYEEQGMMPCGTFWVDEVKLTGGASGDECSIRALTLRSSLIHSEQAYQDCRQRPLQEVITAEADKLGYKVVGDLSGTWSGLQQETGLRFINRVAHETGRICRLEGDTLVFYPLDEILNAGAAIEIDRRDVSSYDISDKAAGRISRCTVKWWDRKTKKLIAGSHDAGIKGGGSVIIWQEVKDAAEAQQKAQDHIKDRDKKGVEFTMTVAGDIRLQAGVTVRTVGFGRFDGLYYIGEVTHTQSSGGYTSQLTLQKPEQEK